MWWNRRKGLSQFSGSSTAEEVTQGIDATGLTAIITGASSGIGFETSRILALRGVYVVMAVRNLVAGQDAKDKILQDIPSAKIDVMKLDLSSMASVRKFALDYTSSDRPLNLLINNAGVFEPKFTLSQDNIELHFATNYLGHFLLTHLLLDTMKHTATESGREGRIVNVSSLGHKLTYWKGLRLDKLNNRSGYCHILAYGQSKLANILHARELANRLKDDEVKVTANSVHPGYINTNLFRFKDWKSGLSNIAIKLFAKGLEQGAATTCCVALHPQVNGVSGQYYSDCNIGKPSRQARNSILARQLWDFSMDLIQ